MTPMAYHSYGELPLYIYQNSSNVSLCTILFPIEASPQIIIPYIIKCLLESETICNCTMHKKLANEGLPGTSAVHVLLLIALPIEEEF